MGVVKSGCVVVLEVAIRIWKFEVAVEMEDSCSGVSRDPMARALLAEIESRGALTSPSGLWLVIGRYNT